MDEWTSAFKNGPDLNSAAEAAKKRAQQGAERKVRATTRSAEKKAAEAVRNRTDAVIDRASRTNDRGSEVGAEAVGPPPHVPERTEPRAVAAEAAQPVPGATPVGGSSPTTQQRRARWPVLVGGVALIAILGIAALVVLGNRDSAEQDLVVEDSVADQSAPDPTTPRDDAAGSVGADEASSEGSAIVVTSSDEDGAEGQPELAPVDDESSIATEELVDTQPNEVEVVTCGDGEVSEGAHCVPLIVASCSSDVGPLIQVAEVFTLAAVFEPEEANVSFEFDHGDSSGETTPQGLYITPGSYQTTMSWQFGDQSGTESCQLLQVEGLPPGWRECDAGNVPDPTRSYVVRNAGSEGLPVHVGPGTEVRLSDGVLIVPRLGVLENESSHRFVGCWQNETDDEFWWEHEAGGFASTWFIFAE